MHRAAPPRFRALKHQAGEQNGPAFHFLSSDWRGLRRYHFCHRHNRQIHLASIRFGHLPTKQPSAVPGPGTALIRLGRISRGGAECHAGRPAFSALGPYFPGIEFGAIFADMSLPGIFNQRRLAIIFRRGGVVALRPANLTWTPRIICRLCPTEGLLKLRSSAELYVTDRVELISPASQAG
jgi:hypothetical protein